MRAVEPERALNVEWSSDDPENLDVQIAITAYDRRGFVRDISDVMAAEHLSIDALNTVTDHDTSTAHTTVKLAVRDLEQLARVLRRLAGCRMSSASGGCTRVRSLGLRLTLRRKPLNRCWTYVRYLPICPENRDLRPPWNWTLTREFYQRQFNRRTRTPRPEGKGTSGQQARQGMPASGMHYGSASRDYRGKCPSHASTDLRSGN